VANSCSTPSQTVLNRDRSRFRTSPPNPLSNSALLRNAAWRGGKERLGLSGSPSPRSAEGAKLERGRGGEVREMRASPVQHRLARFFAAVLRQDELSSKRSASTASASSAATRWRDVAIERVLVQKHVRNKRDLPIHLRASVLRQTCAFL
jgi:hypothetical protein